MATDILQEHFESFVLTMYDRTNSYEQEFIFANKNTPIGFEPTKRKVYKVINAINQSSAQLRSGEGLSIRGNLSITLNDFLGTPDERLVSDPNDKENGTFFGKLAALYVLQNKRVVFRKHIKDLETGGEKGTAVDSIYRVKTLTNNANGTWTLLLEDELTKTYSDKFQWPLETNSKLRLDIDDGTADKTVIPVDATTDWSFYLTAPFYNYNGEFVIRIGDEILVVTAVNNNQTASATLTVVTRAFNTNVTIDGVTRLGKTVRDEHEAGDDILICPVVVNTPHEDVWKHILEEAGVPSSYIPIADWKTELDEWHPLRSLTAVFYEPTSVKSYLQRMLEGLMIDMWYSPEDEEIKISAISAWQQTSQMLRENAEIDFNSLKWRQLDERRFSRAWVAFDKRNITAKEEVTSYKQASLAVNTLVESSYLYDEVKQKRFEPNRFINNTEADLLVNRYIGRFSNSPKEFSWKTQERFLSFAIGDVVTIDSKELQLGDGRNDTSTRMQITSIRTTYGLGRRQYLVKALSYNPQLSGDPIIPITNGSEVNLYVAAGAPSQALTITFILSGVFGSTSHLIPTIQAGDFPAGSKIIIILRDGAILASKGGAGGDGGDLDFEDGIEQPFDGYDGGAGGTVYDANGVDTDIWIGSTANSDPEGGTADGCICAGGGGGGGAAGGAGEGAGGGGGGRGFNGGDKGLGGSTYAPVVINVDGSDGNINQAGSGGGDGVDSGLGGNGGDYGQAGTAGQGGAIVTGGQGGAAGKGVVTDGATVRMYSNGTSGANFINGNGDSITIVD